MKIDIACIDCGRTPLPEELINGHDGEWLCEKCLLEGWKVEGNGEDER